MLNFWDAFLWLGTITLLVGYFTDFRKHSMRAVGYISLGLFWVGESPHFFQISDYVNAAFCIAALPLFLYFAYHEHLSERWDEDPEYMNFLAGGVGLAMLIYFGVERIPILAGSLIKIVTDQTVWLTRLMGYNFRAGTIHYVGNPLYYRVNNNNLFVPIHGSSINIILACTALQTLAPAFSLIYCTATETIRKLKALLVVLPTIYIANIGRNALVMYLTVENITSFEMAHNQIAKTGSVILLIILLMVVFEIMPEFHDNIMNIIELYKREPNRQKQQR